MDAKSQELLDAALKLPETERAGIVEGLLESLSSETEIELDEEWEAELDRRRAEFEESGSNAISWDELKRQKRGWRAGRHGPFPPLGIRRVPDCPPSIRPAKRIGGPIFPG